MTGVTDLTVERSYEAAEAIAGRRTPHLYRVARLFSDSTRFRAFCAAYASMRWVDDRVDGGDGVPEELVQWEEQIRANFRGQPGRAIYGPALADTLARFELPVTPWEQLSKAMRHDLEHDGFATYADFLEYAEGATVAPASVFGALLLMRPKGDCFCSALPFGRVRDAVRASAVACYEVHILRDAREDLAAGRRYFPRKELKQYHLEEGRRLNERWRPYLRAYAMRVRGGWEPAIAGLLDIEGPMTPRERLMLHLLVEFYGRSLQKIIRMDCDVWSDRHWPDADDIRRLLIDLARRYEPEADLEALAVRAVEDV